MIAAAEEVDFRTLMRADGSSTVLADCGVAVDVGMSMVDELGYKWLHGRPGLRGIRPVWHPGSWQDASTDSPSEVQRVLDLLLGYARETDPNAALQALMFSEQVFGTESIHLGTVSNWLRRNRPTPDEMHGTKAAPALQAFATIIAQELGVPEIATLADYTEDGTVPPAIIPATRPYRLSIVGDGDPDDYYVVLNLLRAFSRTAIMADLVFVSNQPMGHDVFLSYVHESQGSSFVWPNVRFVDIGNPTRLSNQEIASRLVAGTAERVRSMRDAGVLIHR